MSSHLPSFSTETYAPDELIAGDHPIRTVDGTLVSGQTVSRGALLGIITASGKFALSASAAADGSQTPVGIAVEDVDASDGDAAISVYVAGDFNTEAMTFGTGHTADSVRAALAARSIYLHDPVAR